MNGFVRIADTLINTDRLMAVQRQAANGSIAEHYLAVFDTGQKVMLSLEAGAALAEHYPRQESKPSEGMMATTSESAI